MVKSCIPMIERRISFQDHTYSIIADRAECQRNTRFFNDWAVFESVGPSGLKEPCLISVSPLILGGYRKVSTLLASVSTGNPWLGRF